MPPFVNEFDCSSILAAWSEAGYLDKNEWYRRPIQMLNVVQGEVFDVAVDLRVKSGTFGRWIGVILNEENHRQLYIPPGFAHGFCVLSEWADLIYKCTDYYCPEHEQTIRWDDPTLAISWPVDRPIVSQKDRRGTTFLSAECFLVGNHESRASEDSGHESRSHRSGGSTGPRVLQTTRR